MTSQALFGILTAMTAMGTLALNITLPALPGLAQQFGAEAPTLQWTVTAYLLGWALGLLVCGALSDRHGRRPVLLGGVALYVLGSAVCALAAHIDTVIAGRFVQAAGGSVGLALSAAIVQDLHDPQRATRLFAVISALTAVVPASAAFTGGLLTEGFGWRGGFVLVAGCGLVMFGACYCLLRETRPSSCSTPTRWADVFGALGELGRNRLFVGNGMNFVMTNAAYYAFIGGAAHVAINLRGLTPSAFGLWFSLVPVGYFVGSVLAGRLASQLPPQKVVRAGTLLALGGAGAMGSWAALGAPGIAPLFLAMAVVAAGNGISHPAAVAGAVAADPRHAGTAAGVKGFLQMAVGAAATWLVGTLQADSPLPTVVAIAAALIAALGFHGMAARGAHRARGPVSDTRSRSASAGA